MCLTCGCGDAHEKMGNNLTYESIRDIAVENHQAVDQTLATLARTAAEDRVRHAEEYARPWEADKDSSTV